MTKLVLYFESEKIRRHFLEDISELIFWQDSQRCEPYSYEDTVMYAVPDLESYDSRHPDSSVNRLSYQETSIAIDPRYSAYWVNSSSNCLPVPQ